MILALEMFGAGLLTLVCIAILCVVSILTDKGNPFE